jgi:outer membrane protein assembly factor BamD
VDGRDAPNALRLACLTAALIAAGCASTPAEEEEMFASAEENYQAGMEILEGRRLLFFFKSVDHARAIKYFQYVVDNFPYSDHAALAELRIADTHFSQGTLKSYEEAQSYYQDFVELHPNHPKVPYAIYRNGLCSYQQMRGTDRDQKSVRAAAAQFEALLQRYPDSEEAGDARAKLADIQQRMARHELDIADFYYEQGLHHAAVQRYRRALEQFPEHEGNLETQTRIGFSLAQLRRPGEAERVLRGALQRAEDPELRERIELELDRIAHLPSYGPEPLPRSCETDPNPACESSAPASFVEEESAQ